MDTAGNSYCRLCAELKPNNKLMDLNNEERKLREISEKLDQLNATTNFDEENLPKSVCYVCFGALNKAFDFVIGVRQAQGVLNSLILLKDIKKEIDTTSYDDFVYDSGNVKNEDVNVKMEMEIEQPSCSKVGKTSKKRSQTSSDSIPLSQLKLTWKDFNWTCAFCDTQFPTLEELVTHSIEYHKCCNAFRCPDCRIRKLQLRGFLKHVKQHRTYLRLSCFKCHKKFKTSRETNLHVKEHKDENSCSGCNRSFPTQEELEEHATNFYQAKRSRSTVDMQKMSEDLTCMICLKIFKNKGSLNTHLLIHTDRKRDHTCEVCGKCFLNKQHLAGHMMLHENTRPYSCEICKMGFKTQYQLRQHVGVHDNKKPFACEKCGRCFRLQRQLVSHYIIHTDSLPYECSYCKKRFRFKTILNQHVRQHTGVRPYSCKICQRDFTNWPNYNKHMKRKHDTDMAKKKHTPDGLYPIDPSTGQVIVTPESNNLLEWKKEMMKHRRPGRPGRKNDDFSSLSDPKINIRDNIAKVESIEEPNLNVANFVIDMRNPNAGVDQGIPTIPTMNT